MSSPSWLNGINTEKITKVYTSDKLFKFTKGTNYFTDGADTNLGGYVNHVNNMLNQNKFTHYILFATNNLQTGQYCAIVVGTNDEITTGIDQTFRYVNNDETSMLAFNGDDRYVKGWGNSSGTGTLTISTIS